MKLEMASNFTRILSNENMSPNSIELACAVRQPSPCVRAFCESGVLFHMSHLKLHFALHSLHSSHSTLHTSHSTLRTSHCTLPTPHFKLHTTLHTSQSTLHTSYFSLLSSHSTLHTSHSTLHTALFTPHTSHCILRTPHFISSELFSPYPSSSLPICHLSFHESLPSTSSTAQGGGGSFKNRKPIGEVGCCESGMAKPLMD